ncbi:MAG: hypothetical protein IJB24_00385 [Clostridia bacterium]|nr:hypothetical protein [Clostridia bacterium]MBQ4601290.1 hypothetical protein [Clostridia bacterium]
MEYIFLIIIFIVIIIAEYLLDNIMWIGGVIIVLLAISIIRQIIEDIKYGFDMGEFVLFLLKGGFIAGILWLMENV